MARTYLEGEFRQVLQNLCYPEIVRGFEPREWVKKMAEANVKVVAVDAKTQFYSLHPTEVYIHDPVLQGRDLFGEVIESAKEFGLKTIAYIAPNTYDVLYRTRSEWQQCDADGNPVGCYKWKTFFCWNTGFGEFYQDTLREIAVKYSPHGFYIDGLLLMRNACYCDVCREKFERETGVPIPLYPAWDKKDWYLYLDWRYQQMAVAAELTAQAVHGVDPKIEIISNCPHAWCGWYSGQSYQMAKHLDRVGTEVHVGIGAKYPGQDLWSSAVSAAYRVMVTRMLCRGKRSHSYFYVPKEIPLAEAIVTLNAVLGFGGVPCIQGDTPYYSELMKRIEPVEELLGDAIPISKVGLVFSDRTRDGYYKDKDALFFKDISGMFQVLQENHMQFDLIGDHDLTVDVLSLYETIILPNVAVLTSKAKESLERYVKEGGHLLATYETGRFGLSGNICSDELLWPGLGIYIRNHITSSPPKYVTEDGMPEPTFPTPPDVFLKAAAGRSMFEWLGSASSQQSEGLVSKLEGERVLLKLLDGAFNSDPREGVGCLEVEVDEKWSTDVYFDYRTDVLGPRKPTPAIVRRDLGKGSILYLGFRLERILAESSEDIWENLLVNCLRKDSKSDEIHFEFPKCVSMRIWERQKPDMKIIYLLNDLAFEGKASGHVAKNMVPVGGTLRINTHEVKSVENYTGDGEVDVVKDNSGLAVTIKNMKERQVLIMHME